MDDSEQIKLRTLTNERNIAENVCWRLENVGIPCPFCGADFMPQPNNHSESCPWRQWRVSRDTGTFDRSIPRIVSVVDSAVFAKRVYLLSDGGFLATNDDAQAFMTGSPLFDT